MTGREELEMMEMKLLKKIEQDGLCPKCGKPIPSGAQLAHRINQGPNNKRNLEKRFKDEFGPGIGKKIIYHPLNMVLSCPGRCNSSFLVDNKPLERARLINKILDDIRGKNG